MLIVINGSEQPVEFTLPECTGACRWSLLIDTEDGRTPRGSALVRCRHRLSGAGRSLLVFVREPEATESTSGRRGASTL